MLADDDRSAPRSPRRHFLLQLMTGGAIGLAGGAIALGELARRGERPPQMLADLDTIPAGTARVFDDRGVVLVHQLDGTLIALSTRCTHLGCRINLAGAELRCPCHQGRYDLAGQVLAGPPPRPLRRYALWVAADHRVYYYPDQRDEGSSRGG